ncbi:MAG: SEC-C metal-binding domain-containing protein [Actinomycetota bacterium]
MGKRARKKQRAEGGQRPSRSALRKAAKDLARQLDALLVEAEDPDADASSIATRWLDLLDKDRSSEMSGELLFRRVGRERAEAIADAVGRLVPGTLSALLLRAEVAELAGDDATAVPLYEEALALDDRPVTRWCYALSLQGCGRLADSVEVLEAMLRADPADDSAHDAYRDVMREIDERFETLAEDESCPCGSGALYEKCCLEREEAALGRFDDRRVFDELREKLAAFMGRGEYRGPVVEALRDWLGMDEDDGDDPGELFLEPAETQLFAEWALAAGIVPIDDEDPDIATSLLAEFAEDPATNEESARRARDWHEHCRYGLWVVEDTVPRPTICLREILTRERMWVEMPPALLEDRARWEVLLGYVVPVDGIWRMGGSFMPLTPAIGDAVARSALEIVEGVVVGMMREHGRSVPKRLLHDELFDLPPSLRDPWDEPSPIPSFVMLDILKQAFPTLVREARELSDRPISLQNMDGETVELIKARITLDDPARFRRTVSNHPDFEVDDDEIVWHGRELTRFERDQQLAMLRDQGLEIPEADDPGRWVKARLIWDDDHLQADVNSRERLASLMDLLEDIAGGASIKEEITVDPSQDFPLPVSSAVSLRSVSPGEDEAWRRAWLDESVPGLSGMTPRAASRSKRGRVLLEAMLRHFEYEADRTLAAGATPRDIGALREVLGLPKPWSYLERSV